MEGDLDDVALLQFSSPVIMHFTNLHHHIYRESAWLPVMPAPWQSPHDDSIQHTPDCSIAPVATQPAHFIHRDRKDRHGTAFYSTCYPGIKLETHEQRYRAQIATPYSSFTFEDPYAPMPREDSWNDSTYESMFEVTSLPYSPINTLDSNASSPHPLTEDTLGYGFMPSTRTELKCSQLTSSSDAFLVSGLEGGISHVVIASCPPNAEECDEEGLATDDEDMDVGGHSRAPTPWPESWYEGGKELGLQQFAARVIADCLGHGGDAEAVNDEFSTSQCPADNDAGHNGHEHTGATTTGASSATGQTTHSGRQSSGDPPTKRPRSSDDGDSEEDRPPKRRDAKGPPDNDANPRKLYACPYQKRIPQQSPFCGMPHGSKRDFGWDNVSRVKYVSRQNIVHLLLVGQQVHLLTALADN
ncbi:hypothetical protein B0J18DRAFT_411207 [Chaetomium sp. MPI-SDFR-AT-0129]|nr:hypothetical protein B0J18DRAFT_411207 [Chaetomium sp. MPI-SDFR-AT-0129]